MRKCQSTAISALIILLELAVYVATVFFLLEGFAFVILAFAPADVDVKLCTTIVINKKECGHNAEAWRLDGLLHLANLLAVKEKLAVSALHMVVIGALIVLGNIHVLHPDLASNDVTIGIHKACLALADALYLCTRQHDACRVFIQKQIVELGTLVLDINVFPFVRDESLSHFL